MKTLLLKETELVNLIKRVINEQTYSYQQNLGDPYQQCQDCQLLHNHPSYANWGITWNDCQLPCFHNAYVPILECEMCKKWYFMMPGSISSNCMASGKPCDPQWAEDWQTNHPCYKCDKFGNIDRIWKYSQFNTSRGPCPSGYQKDLTCGHQYDEPVPCNSNPCTGPLAIDASHEFEDEEQGNSNIVQVGVDRDHRGPKEDMPMNDSMV